MTVTFKKKLRSLVSRALVMVVLLQNVLLFATPANAAGPQITSIATGYGHTIALKDDGTIWAWGRNDAGQLGDGTLTQASVPVQVDQSSMGTSGITQIDAAEGGLFSAAIVGGNVWTWGDNGWGQLGIGTSGNVDGPTEDHYATPQKVKGAGCSGFLSNIVSIAVGQSHILALDNTGVIWSWGWASFFGQTGHGAYADTSCPAPVDQTSMGTSVTAIAAGGRDSMALDSSGQIWIWGENVSQVLLPGPDGNNRAVPILADQTSMGTSIAAIAAGSATNESHFLSLTTTGEVWQWTSYNDLSNLTPVQVNPSLMGTDVVAISDGAYHSMALDSSGNVFSWGEQTSANFWGQFGAGSSYPWYFGPFPDPVPMEQTSLGYSIAQIEAGGEFSAVLMNNGVDDPTVWTMGHNNQNQLGDVCNSGADSDVPLEMLFGASVCPAPPSGNATGMKDTMSREKKGAVTSQHLVQFDVASSLAAGMSYTFTFPSGFVFATAPIVNGDPNPDSTTSITSACFTGFSYNASGPATITATSAGGCGPGTLYIDGATSSANPGTAGSYTVDISSDDPGADVGSFAVPITDDDQVTVTAMVNPYITFQVVATATPCSHGTDGNSADNSEFGNDGGTVAFGTLTPVAVFSSQDSGGINHICTVVSTNASSGYALTVQSLNGGLTNGSQFINAEATEIAGVAAGAQTLTPGAEGYGMCLSTTTAPSMDNTLPAGMNLTGNGDFAPGTCDDISTDIAKLTTGTQTIGSNGSSPVQEGTAQWNLKASIAATTGAGSYTDTLTFIATGTF